RARRLHRHPAHARPRDVPADAGRAEDRDDRRARHRHRQRDRRGAQPAAQVRRQVEGDHRAHRRGEQRRQHLSGPGGALRADAGGEDLHGAGGEQRRRGDRRQPAAPAGQPEAARGDRLDDRRDAVPGDRHPRPAREVPEDPRGSAEVAHPRPRHAVRGALPPLFAGGLRAAGAGDGAAPHPVSTAPLTMRFANPHALWLLLAVPAAVLAYGLGFATRLRRLGRLGDPALVALMAATVSVPRKVARAALVVTSFALLALALARPQAGGRARVAQQRGLDLVVALDFSRSMLAKDVYPSRLERAKRELEQLLDTLGGDRVGVVAFAGESLTYPPTTDYAAVKLFWRDLGPWDMPVGGTAIGRAIKSGLEQLTALRSKGGATRGQAILLLTDGEDTDSEPLQAAEEASKLGVKIFTVGIGSRSGELIPEYDEQGKVTGYVKDADGHYVTSRLAEETLAEIARKTNGEYFHADSKRFGVEDVERALGGLKRTENEAR